MNKHIIVHCKVNILLCRHPAASSVVEQGCPYCDKPRIALSASYFCRPVHKATLPAVILYAFPRFALKVFIFYRNIRKFAVNYRLSNISKPRLRCRFRFIYRPCGAADLVRAGGTLRHCAFSEWLFSCWYSPVLPRQIRVFALIPGLCHLRSFPRFRGVLAHLFLVVVAEHIARRVVHCGVVRKLVVDILPGGGYIM